MGWTEIFTRRERGGDGIMNFDQARKHKNWDESKLRIVFAIEKIQCLPLKFVSPIELRKIMSSIDFNSCQIAYPSASFIIVGEVGHDLNHRYVKQE